MRLLALPRGRALFKEGAAPSALSAVAQSAPKRAAFAQQRQFQRQAEAFVDRVQSLGDGQGRVGGDFHGKGLGAGHEFGGRDHFVDQADAERFAGRR